MFEGGGRKNRLADSSSPYLLLHQHNPVDWYPWGEEALARARDEDKPIFVSVGYSTCYWCHVMERESFSDEETAALMNRDFINIKLDREERPDLDEIYMSATQILTGRGGWPNSLFLTPRLEPYFAGTYFPPEDRRGLPSFRTVLRSMAEAWQKRRKDVEEQAKSVARAIRHHLADRPPAGEDIPGMGVVRRSLGALTRGFDREWGGFGSAPKFPSPPNLILLHDLAGRDVQAAKMLSVTLDAMARGGIYDQFGGGFHRYATDREWKVPHFEKMLYDNGWLLEAYAREWARSGDPQAARVVEDTAAFLEREMTSPEGAFFSALDAETDGHEGAFYVWRREELLDILGEEDFNFLAPLFGFDGPAFFEGDAYVPYLPERLEVQARRRRMSPEELLEQIAPLKRKLFRARGTRRRPLTDDKILTDWNGAAIGGLALAGRLLAAPSLINQAAAAAEFILDRLVTTDGMLLHACRNGSAHTPALLGDYAYLVRGLLALYRATDDGRWLERAKHLTDQQEAVLADPEGGFFVAPESDDILVRSRDLFDGAEPAANGIAVLNLLELSELDPSGNWGASAESALRAFAPVIGRVPEATRTLTSAIWRLIGKGGEDLSEDAEEDREAGTSTGVIEVVFQPATEAVRGAFSFELQIASGWHIYGKDPDNELPAGVQALQVEGRQTRLLDLEISAPQVGQMPIHRDVVRISGRAERDGKKPRMVISFQACDDRRCLAPESVVVDLSDIAV
jgi:uncharacterized protein YyaL (SSP411 family)